MFQEQEFLKKEEKKPDLKNNFCVLTKDNPANKTCAPLALPLCKPTTQKWNWGEWLERCFFFSSLLQHAQLPLGLPYKEQQPSASLTYHGTVCFFFLKGYWDSILNRALRKTVKDLYEARRSDQYVSSHRVSFTTFKAGTKLGNKNNANHAAKQDYITAECESDTALFQSGVYKWHTDNFAVFTRLAKVPSSAHPDWNRMALL